MFLNEWDGLRETVVSSCGANRDIKWGKEWYSCQPLRDRKRKKGTYCLGSSEVFSWYGYYGHINKVFTESNLLFSRVVNLILGFIFPRLYLFNLKATLLPPILPCMFLCVLPSPLLLDACYVSLALLKLAFITPIPEGKHRASITNFTVSDFRVLSTRFPDCRSLWSRYLLGRQSGLLSVSMMSSPLLLPKLAGLKLAQECLLGLWLHLNCNVNRLWATEHLHGPTPSPLPLCRNLWSHPPIHCSLTFYKPFKLRTPFV